MHRQTAGSGPEPGTGGHAPSWLSPPSSHRTEPGLRRHPALRLRQSPSLVCTEHWPWGHCGPSSDGRGLPGDTSDPKAHLRPRTNMLGRQGTPQIRPSSALACGRSRPAPHSQLPPQGAAGQVGGAPPCGLQHSDTSSAPNHNFCFLLKTVGWPGADLQVPSAHPRPHAGAARRELVLRGLCSGHYRASRLRARTPGTEENRLQRYSPKHSQKAGGCTPWHSQRAAYSAPHGDPTTLPTDYPQPPRPAMTGPCRPDPAQAPGQRQPRWRGWWDFLGVPAIASYPKFGLVAASLTHSSDLPGRSGPGPPPRSVTH